MYTLEKPILTRQTNAPAGYSPKTICWDSLHYDTRPLTTWQYVDKYIRQIVTYIKLSFRRFTEWICP